MEYVIGIKPENILFSNVADDSSLKLIDFGLSKVLDGENQLKGAVGTTFYMAPEVIEGKYNEKCDLWACGVILYNFIYNVMRKTAILFPE